MWGSTSARTVVTLVTALCVVTMFAGVGSAQLGLIDQDVDGEVNSAGGSGSGFLNASAPGSGYANGTAGLGANATEQEVDVALGGEGSAAGEHVEASLDCTLSPEAAESVTGACETAPVDVGGVSGEYFPQNEIGLGEAIVFSAIQNPESVPSLLTLLGSAQNLPIGAVPMDEIPFDAIPWEQVPTDQIPTEDIPRLSEEIPWDQIPDEQVPLGQPNIDQQLSR